MMTMKKCGKWENCTWDLNAHILKYMHAVYCIGCISASKWMYVNRSTIAKMTHKWQAGIVLRNDLMIRKLKSISLLSQMESWIQCRSLFIRHSGGNGMCATFYCKLKCCHCVNERFKFIKWKSQIHNRMPKHEQGPCEIHAHQLNARASFNFIVSIAFDEMDVLNWISSKWCQSFNLATPLSIHNFHYNYIIKMYHFPQMIECIWEYSESRVYFKWFAFRYDRDARQQIECWFNKRVYDTPIETGDSFHM